MLDHRASSSEVVDIRRRFVQITPDHCAGLLVGKQLLLLLAEAAGSHDTGVNSMIVSEGFRDDHDLEVSVKLFANI